MVVRYLGSRPAWHSTFDRKRGCDARDRALPSNAIVQSVAQGCHVELRDRHHRHGREFFPVSELQQLENKLPKPLGETAP